MEIEPKKVSVRDLVDGYKDLGEDGVFGYSGALDIRPPYQREFIYDRKQRNAVLETVKSGFPLNVMYWAARDDGTFEVIDGQQRTLSLCQFVDGDFADGNDLYFHSLPKDIQDSILNYQLMVYVCEGTDSEKLDWFQIVNISGEELTDQEIRNAVYAGTWLADAKRHFSKTGCPAQGLASDYLKGSAIRQDYLETAIDWISDGEIRLYMGENQHKPNAKPLWLHFKKVIDWVEATFPVKRSREMKQVAWGDLYRDYGEEELDPTELENKISLLMGDDEIARKSGIYPYVLDGKERHLNLRQFSPNQKREVFEAQAGSCAACSNNFELEEMEADHIKQWAHGGKTVIDNCQLLCRDCHQEKTAK